MYFGYRVNDRSKKTIYMMKLTHCTTHNIYITLLCMVVGETTVVGLHGETH